MHYRLTENRGPYTVYDPCCGGAILLTEVALLNPSRICRIVASDVNSRALETANRNLQILTAEGARERLLQIEADFRSYGKQSHKEALDSAQRIYTQVISDRAAMPLTVDILHADATKLDIQARDVIGIPDIVLADIPYGIESHWQIDHISNSEPVEMLLGSLLKLPCRPVIAIAANKKTRVEHASYRRFKRLWAGKRQIVFLISLGLREP